mgnify:FL=1|tara:strand:+ start:436 stop:831 length:396 start_codon:yes stop_codon:yes gene_type:complete
MMSLSMRQWKGNRLQQTVVNAILYCFPSLNKEDAISTPPSVNGADVILSDKAKELFSYKVECKNHNRIKALYEHMNQAETHEGAEEPLVVFKSDKKPPLAVVHLNHFVELTAYKAKYLEITNKNNPERNII